MISGSGQLKYLYSPRPKPCRPMTTRLRKRLSLRYRPAIIWHSSGDRMRGSIAFPCASNSFEVRGQSMELTRAAPDSAEIVIASRFLVDVFIDLLSDPYEDKLTKNPARNTPFLAFKFHESEFYANRCQTF